MGDKTSVSLFEAGMPGLHLIINPQRKPAPSAQLNQHFRQRGIPLSSQELQSLLAGREQGIASLNRTLGKLVPSLKPDARLKLSTQIADLLLDKSLQAQLSREAPTIQEQVEQRAQALNARFAQPPSGDAQRGALPTLLRQVPVGVSLTLHF